MAKQKINEMNRREVLARALEEKEMRKWVIAQQEPILTILEKNKPKPKWHDSLKFWK